MVSTPGLCPHRVPTNIHLLPDSHILGSFGQECPLPQPAQDLFLEFVSVDRHRLDHLDCSDTVDMEATHAVAQENQDCLATRSRRSGYCVDNVSDIQGGPVSQFG